MTFFCAGCHLPHEREDLRETASEDGRLLCSACLNNDEAVRLTAELDDGSSVTLEWGDA